MASATTLPLSAYLLRRFFRLAVQRSPENLSCDGEIRGSALVRRAQQIDAEWHKLEKEAGRTVSEDEIYELAQARNLF